MKTKHANASDLPYNAKQQYNWLSKLYTCLVRPGERTPNKVVLGIPLTQKSCLTYRRPELLFPNQSTSEPWTLNEAVAVWQFDTYRRSD